MVSCYDCGAPLSATSTKCNVCGSTSHLNPVASKQTTSNPVIPHGYCGSCGTALTAKLAPCPKCGHVKTTLGSSSSFKQSPTPPSPGYKNSATVLVLAGVLGILGICGIGHFYVGKIGRGVVILIVGLVLSFITLGTNFYGLIAFLPFFGWTIYDVDKLSKYYNHILQTRGSAPW